TAPETSKISWCPNPLSSATASPRPIRARSAAALPSKAWRPIEMSRFSPDTLVIDAEAEIARITSAMRNQLRTDLKRRGLVLGLSGGIDSSLCAALAVKAVGPDRVFGIFMPENDSDPESLALGRAVAETFGFAAEVEDIGPALGAMGCYERRDDFIRTLVPEFGEGWGCKVVIADPLSGGGIAISSLVVQ